MKKEHILIIGILIILAGFLLIKGGILGNVIFGSGPKLEVSFEYENRKSVLSGDFTKITGEVYNKGNEIAYNTSVDCYLFTESRAFYEEIVYIGPVSPDNNAFFKVSIDGDLPAAEVSCEPSCENCKK